MQHVGSSSLTRDRTWAPAQGTWSLSHWTTRKVLGHLRFGLHQLSWQPSEILLTIIPILCRREFYVLVLVIHIKIVESLRMSPSPWGYFVGRRERGNLWLLRWVLAHTIVGRLCSWLMYGFLPFISNLYFHSFPPWILISNTVFCIYVFSIYLYGLLCWHLIFLLNL